MASAMLHIYAGWNLLILLRKYELHRNVSRKKVELLHSILLIYSTISGAASLHLKGVYSVKYNKPKKSAKQQIMTITPVLKCV